MRSRRHLTILALVCCAAFAACGGGSHGEHDGHDHAADPAAADHDHGTDSNHAHGDPGPTGEAVATAELSAKSGASLTGEAVFAATADGHSLTVTVENAPPGPHAVHIHETGDCSAADGTSAGGHWNPEGVDHGAWGGDAHHLGDIGNMVVGEDGTGTIVLSTDRWTVGDGAPTDVLGKSIIVHVGADDFTTQPTGAAGGRIGCGVIAAAGAN